MIYKPKNLQWQRNIVLTDFVYKVNMKNVFSIPNINYMLIHVNYNHNDFDIIISSYIELFLINNQKPFIIKCLKSQLKHNLKKGNPIGIKVKLREKSCLRFFEVLNLFTSINNDNFLRVNKSFNYDINMCLKNAHFYSFASPSISPSKKLLNSIVSFNNVKKNN